MKVHARSAVWEICCGVVLLLCILTLPAPAFADDPRAVQARLKQAEQALRAKTKEVIQTTKGLGKNLDDGLKRIKELERHVEDLYEGRARASTAAELAENALEAAKNCRKSEFDRLSKEAKESIKKAEQAQNRARKLLDAAQKMRDYIDSLRSMGEQEYEDYKKAAEAAGLGDRFGVATDDFEFHKDALLKELSMQPWKVGDYEKAAADLHRKILEINEALDEALKDADQELREAKALRDKGCAPKTAGGFKAPSMDLLDSTASEVQATGTAGQATLVDITVTVDNRLTVLICIPPGDDPAKVTAALGLADYEVVAQISTGTVIAAEGDPQVIDAKAKDKGINLCFVEINFCVIKAPLTAFRGHQHKAHPGGIHNHDAPDPPWSWAVTPPESVLSWEGK